MTDIFMSNEKKTGTNLSKVLELSVHPHHALKRLAQTVQYIFEPWHQLNQFPGTKNIYIRTM